MDEADHRSVSTEPRGHILTVGLEDYFQVGAFHRVIQHRQWYRFEPVVERGTFRTLALLEEHGAKATFFVLGWVAEEFPELIREISRAGHEVASKGYYHRGIGQMTPAEFREDLARAREALESATGVRIQGYRVPGDWFRPSDLWALDILADEGYAYDSSIALLGRRYSAEPWRGRVHTHHGNGTSIVEVPVSSARWMGVDVPIAGGNYIRQLPNWLMRSAVKRWMRSTSQPFVMYFHTWEMDEKQPRIEAASWIQRTRHYRNLDRMPELVAWYLTRSSFSSIAGHMGIEAGATSVLQPPRRREVRTGPPEVARDPGARHREAVSVVIPCYNEEVVIPYLGNTLDRMKEELGDRFRFEFIFVDDASVDRTWSMLQTTFGHRDDCVLISRRRNGGVARAVLTGILSAETEKVCSIDCDCSYDPLYLGSMIPLLDPDTDMVTASPYHRDGGVRNVPAWRLVLSRGLSRMYRLVLGEDIHTFTSCFRVYRRTAFIHLSVARGGFLGVAEMLGRLSLQGGRIREFPAVLEARLIGHSKMRVLTTILGHLGLLASLGWKRARKDGGATRGAGWSEGSSTERRGADRSLSGNRV